MSAPAGQGHRRRVAAGLAALISVAALAAGCASSPGGTSLGELRTSAKRVVGGGAECPLTIDVSAAVRAQGFTGVVQPDQRNPGHAADATVEDDRIRVVCRFLVGRQRLTLVVTGVGKGHALAAALGDVEALGGVSKADAAAFVNLMSDRRGGEARPLPGQGRAAASVVTTADSSSQAIVVGSATVDGVVPAPGDGSGDVLADREHLVGLTAALADDLAN